MVFTISARTFIARMACFHIPAESTNKSKWYFDDVKCVKLFGRDNRIAFQRKGKYTRGCTITKEAFQAMEDVSLTPNMKLELDENILLINYGNRIHLIKYCMTSDAKRCQGGFFHFTPKEWQYFWKTMRSKINGKLLE